MSSARAKKLFDLEYREQFQNISNIQNIPEPFSNVLIYNSSSPLVMHYQGVFWPILLLLLLVLAII